MNLKFIKKYWFKIFTFVIIGALGGFSYYYFIGCYSGTCPITSNPYISTSYGAMIGLLLSVDTKKIRKKAND